MIRVIRPPTRHHLSPAWAKFDVWRIGVARYGRIYSGVVPQIPSQKMDVVTSAKCQLPARFHRYTQIKGRQHRPGDPRCWCGIYGCVTIGSLAAYAEKIRSEAVPGSVAVVMYRVILSGPILRSVDSYDPPGSWRGSTAEMVAPIISLDQPLQLRWLYNPLGPAIELPGGRESFDRLAAAQPVPHEEPCQECWFVHDHAPDCNQNVDWWLPAKDDQ